MRPDSASVATDGVAIPWRILIVTLLASTLSSMDQSLFGYAVPGIMADLKIGLPGIGPADLRVVRICDHRRAPDQRTGCARRRTDGARTQRRRLGAVRRSAGVFVGCPVVWHRARAGIWNQRRHHSCLRRVPCHAFTRSRSRDADRRTAMWLSARVVHRLIDRRAVVAKSRLALDIHGWLCRRAAVFSHLSLVAARPAQPTRGRNQCCTAWI